MVLRRIFGKKGEDEDVEEPETKEPDESVMAVAGAAPEVDPKMAEVINENVEESVKQKQKEAESTIKEKKAMAESDKTKSLSKASTSEVKKKLRPEVRPHAFVVMPFGKKTGGDGSKYDFNAIYESLIKPALEQAGFEAFRADEATASGDILTDMFQELLLADLVLADLSIDNANAFYELGIRHAFRKRGVVHIQAGRAYMPFDIFNVRTLPYHITAEGVPDQDCLEQDKQAIARLARDTWASDRDAVHSPIFNLLSGLSEPDPKALRTPLATGFWREYNEWEKRLTIAQRQKRIGDILLLTEEITNSLIKEEAVGRAGQALASMGRYELALIQYRKGLEINPKNLSFRRQEAFHLNRVGRKDEAIVKIEAILADHPEDGEATAYLGRIYKEMWTDSWRWVENPEKRLRTAFESYHWLLKAYQIYLRGFRTDLDQFYPGINALTLGIILVYLADQFDDKSDPDLEIAAIREDLPELRSTLEFALEIQSANPSADYWTLVSLAELHVLSADNLQHVMRAYRKAITASRRSTFVLESSIQQLEILDSLGLRPEYITAGITILKEELARIRKEERSDKKKDKEETSVLSTTSRAFVFTGYRLYNGEEQGCFQADMEEAILAEIEGLLDKYNVSPKDLAITTGMAAGGDLLFIEACAARGILVATHMPVPEPDYVRDFVSPAGNIWVERFYKMRNHIKVDEHYQLELVGKPKPGDNPHERNNRWALYSAMVGGMENLVLIALYEYKLGDRRDTLDARLVKHMIDLTRDAGGQVEIITSTKPLQPRSNGRPAKKRAGAGKKEKT